jgi:hypothetical protein
MRLIAPPLQQTSSPIDVVGSSSCRRHLSVASRCKPDLFMSSTELARWFAGASAFASVQSCGTDLSRKHMSWLHRSHRLGNHSCWWHAASDVCTHLLRFREVPEQVSHKIFDFLGPSSMGVEPTAKHASVMQPQQAQQKQSLQPDSKWISWYPNLVQDSDPVFACV